MTPEEFDKMMYEAVRKGQTVHVVDIDDIEYEGLAESYCQADDEDDGFATFCIDDPKVNICLGSNEIKSFEVVA